MDIAVIGGGHGCYAAASEFADKGHAVRLWRQNADAFRSVLENRKLKLTDHLGTRDVAIHLPTLDLREAIAGAELVVIPLPCTVHLTLAKMIAPHFEDGQVVYIPPATFGTYIFAKALADSGNTAQVAFAETGTLPYLARKQTEDHVRVSVYATRLPTGVFPARASDRALSVISKVYSGVEPLKDALDGALMNAGPIIHPPLIMMNAGPLEHFEAWDIHNEGTVSSIRRVTDALDQERVKLREAFGYGAPHFPLSDHYDDDAEEWMYGDSSHEKLTDSGDWRENINLLSHRYMREDSALGLSFLSSLGDLMGTPLPLVNGFLSIASGITGEDLRASGRTLESLALDALSVNELRALLQDGFVA